LKNNPDHRAAVKAITKASFEFQDSRDNGVLDYLDTLAHLIDEYEVTH
jgi:hypothetical protein